MKMVSKRLDSSILVESGKWLSTTAFIISLVFVEILILGQTNRIDQTGIVVPCAVGISFEGVDSSTRYPISSIGLYSNAACTNSLMTSKEELSRTVFTYANDGLITEIYQAAVRYNTRPSYVHTTAMTFSFNDRTNIETYFMERIDITNFYAGLISNQKTNVLLKYYVDRVKNSR